MNWCAAATPCSTWSTASIRSAPAQLHRRRCQAQRDVRQLAAAADRDAAGRRWASDCPLAAFTIRRTLTLETELQKRYDEGVRAQQELKELSARLVSAQEEERRAISRELHDEVGQSLSALLMEAGNAAASVPQDSADVRRHVESIKKLAEASVNVIRNMTLLLRPSMLDDFGLVPALEWQAREVSKRTGLRVHVTAEEGARELPDELQDLHLSRGAGGPAQLRAPLAGAQREGGGEAGAAAKILLSVEDDGHGFDARRVRGPGPGGHGGTRQSSGRRLRSRFAAGRGNESRCGVAAGKLIKLELMSIRILLADDHTVMRNGLRLLLERQPNLQVVGEAADGRQAVELAAVRKTRRGGDGYRHAASERRGSRAPDRQPQPADRDRDPEHA